jgi:formate/nitrite transporter FocA (FNT family)
MADKPGVSEADQSEAQESPADKQNDEESKVEAHGPPEPDNSAAQKNLERPSAEEIFQQVARNAKEELARRSISLAVSGFTGGTFMGFSALGVGILAAMLGTGPKAFLVSRMLYPLGFIVVMIGRSQLFTENTLYPVALVLSEKRELLNTMRLWCTVLPANVLGALAFALLAARTSALTPDTRSALVHLGVTAAGVAPAAIFWSAVTAGWIIATAAWLVSGSHSITGSVIILWILTYLVGLGNFAHCIATSGEILSAVLTHQVATSGYLHWLWIAVAGNVCGGVFMVTLLEYGQAILAKNEKPIEE